MSSKKTTTHVLIPRQLVVYLRERSVVWQCRYSVDGRWQRTSTNERDLDNAKQRAHDILVEANVRKKMNAAPITRYFKDIAKHAIARMQSELDGKQGKAIYKDYIGIINRYLIPFFGKYRVDSVDYKLLEQYSNWRAERMDKVAKQSAIANHNAALNRVFDEAMIRGFMVESNRPKLITKGKKSERRPDFSLEEVRALRQNFDAWIDKGRADSKAVRALLKDYVLTLLDTGARPGKELLNLTWAQVTQNVSPTFELTDEIDPEDGERIGSLRANRTAILKIQTSKTGERLAIGRLPTVQAFRNIAERNYGKTLDAMLKTRSTDGIFRFKEYLNDEQLKAGQIPRVLMPTSFSKLFDQYLREHSLLIDPTSGKRRVLYSLRHTYATLALTYDKQCQPLTLTKQMGTSLKMLNDFYGHIDAVKAMHQLRGEESRQLIESGIVDERYDYVPETAAAKRAQRKAKSIKPRKAREEAKVVSKATGRKK